MYQLAPKTEFVAHAIASWITREEDGNTGEPILVRLHEHGTGHVVIWEGL